MFIKKSCEYLFFSPYFKSARDLLFKKSIKKEHAAQWRSSILLLGICMIIGLVCYSFPGLFYGIFIGIFVGFIWNTLRYI